MLHKLRAVMGQRDVRYRLEGIIELDEGFFTTEMEGDEKDKHQNEAGAVSVRARCLSWQKVRRYRKVKNRKANRAGLITSKCL
jgi:hypothetical protein